MPQSPKLLSLLIVPAIALSACGSGSSDKDKITKIVNDGDSNPASICDNLDATLLSQIGGSSGCKAAAAKEKKKTAKVNSVSVTGKTATADVSDSDGPHQKIGFTKVGGDWKISSTP